jgi:ribosomal protein S4
VSEATRARLVRVEIASGVVLLGGTAHVERRLGEVLLALLFAESMIRLGVYHSGRMRSNRFMCLR